MTTLDPQIQASIERSRSDGGYSPPAGVEDRMLAQFHAGLGAPPDPGAGPTLAAGGQVVHMIKIVAAVVGLTAAGLGGVALVGKGVRAARAPQATSVDRSAAPSLEPPTSSSDVMIEAAPTSSAEPPTPSESNQIPAPRPRSPNPQARPELTPPAGAGSSTTLAAELKLIQAARNAPATQALELLDRHAEQFADGELSNEREGLRVIALCQLERVDAAQQAAKRFVSGSPGTLLMQRVGSACGDQISLPTTESKAAGNRSN